MEILDQLKNIVTDEEQTEETEVSWIVEQEKLSDDEKMSKLKELAEYATSEEFKTLKSKYLDKVTEVQKEIRQLAFKRKEAKVIFSILDEYVVAYNATEEIMTDTNCLIFKQYLSSRLEALESAIVKKR